MKPILIFYGVFAAIGTIAGLISFVLLYSSLEKVMSWEESKGKVSMLNGVPAITFDYYGQSRQLELNTDDISVEDGDELTVIFPPDHPDQAEVKNFINLWLPPLFPAFFALVFGAIGYTGGLKQVRRWQAKRDLFTYGKGRKTSLPVSQVVLDKSFKVNGRSPYVIICEYHDSASNKQYEFKSDHIWFDPVQWIDDKKMIDIYIDPNDLNRYYLDTSFLPTEV